MSRPTVVLDACVLIPIRLATTLLWFAEAGLFRPLWSARLLDEVERNLPRLGVAPDSGPFEAVAAVDVGVRVLRKPPEFLVRFTRNL